MRFFDHLQTFLVVGPVVSLLLVGLVLALKSAGSPAPGSGAERVGMALGIVMIRVIGVLAGLLLVQRVVGFPTGLVW